MSSCTKCGESLLPFRDVEGGCEKSCVSTGVGGAPKPGPIVIFLWGGWASALQTKSLPLSRPLPTLGPEKPGQGQNQLCLPSYLPQPLLHWAVGAGSLKFPPPAQNPSVAP